MINFTDRLDKAIRTAAWAHEQQGQHRKGTDIPYIIHPFGVMVIASSVTDDEDTLIACLLHDVLEDVDSKIYDEHKMQSDFGEVVTKTVKDVSKDDSIDDWHERSKAYLAHLENEASEKAVIVCSADKIHNLTTTLTDYDPNDDKQWEVFTTNSAEDQLWWYESVLGVIKKRGVDKQLSNRLAELISDFKTKLSAN